MIGAEIRTRFLEHFAGRDHLVLPSASLVLQRDPTTLFTSAGMQPLKPYFQGLAEPPAPRLASCQKCFRTPDLDEVGKTDRHLTFFEMLGNFTPTGVYFKEGAIPLAWELVTGDKGFRLPVELLRVTVHPTDDEAAEIWVRETGIRPDRVHRNDENWWAAGETGPCGPDSEIWFDRGPGYGCGQPDCYPDHCGRFLEFWNLVFMQFDRQPDGSLPPLPHPGIDTGMGLERMTAVMQGVESNFDTDLLKPIYSRIENDASAPNVVSLRVVTDHVRAMTFLIADGVRPANEGRGYVLRRLIRRAALHARRLGLRSNVSDFVEVVVEHMRDVYPELENRVHAIRDTAREEVDRFQRVLEEGMERFDQAAAHYREVIPGEEAFKLHDTFGFPIEMTTELAAERGLEVDMPGFEAAMQSQRHRSRSMTGRRWLDAVSLPTSEFVGYASTKSPARVVALARDGSSVEALDEGDAGEVWLDRTPFYAEAGGQVGDTGTLQARSGTFTVEDTQKPGEASVAHLGRVVLGTIRVGETIDAHVDKARRRQIARHHSATHLLHRALCDVLGVPGPLQRGSWVGPDHTTFDFPLNRALTREEMEQISRLVNEHVRDALPFKESLLPYSEAIKTRAMHLFEEKYGDVVRVVCFGDWTCEFCGGTHVTNSADVGQVVLMSESSIGAGLRRIDAVAGESAEDVLYRRFDQLEQMARSLGTSPDAVPARVEELRQQLKDAERRVERVQEELRQARIRGADGGAPRVTEGTRVPLLMETVTAESMKDLGGYADGYLNTLKGSGVVAVTNSDSFVIKVSRDLVGEYDANRLKEAFGRGGGPAWFVQGKLERPSQEAFQKLRELLS